MRLWLRATLLLAMSLAACTLLVYELLHGRIGINTFYAWFILYAAAFYTYSHFLLRCPHCRRSAVGAREGYILGLKCKKCGQPY